MIHINVPLMVYDIKPLMECNFDDSIRRVTKNERCCLGDSKSKADFVFLICDRVPGVGLKI